ncbi:zinc finger and BTB domain-containing protein 41 isoform X2 [Zeugodacus cucurbitae]|uniref:zinc finger and BTB domain-containing protein 41 isoform X2 n=1 Tax=Zeugodacus cucurbitae TaxID=28588 RepID=UPI0023D929D9|nr:zinc finger and BTB domain-containing protein 41 isoform X2 [Zeugodacus cucurbitae]
MMQKSNKVNVLEADDASGQNGNKSAGSSRIRKGLARRKKRRSESVEEDVAEEQHTLNNKKLCLICGNSQEIVDLSANPIMKKTMASYCEDDSVNLDDCLSSLCITCVFKSRAVREVQNNIKVRLQSLGNGQILKTSPCPTKKEVNYDREEYNGDIDIAANTLRKERQNRLIKTRTNGVREFMQSSPEPKRTSDTSSRLPTATLTASVESTETNNATFNHLQYTSLSKCIGINTVLDNSIGEADNKNALQFTEYRLTEITDTKSIQQLEAKRSEVNPTVHSSLLSTERIELLSLTNVPELPSSCSNSTHSHIGMNQSMLQVIRERSESVLITESGGKINNYKSSSRAQPQRVCRYCGNNYVRKDHYNKHIRRCRNQYSRSLPSLSANVTNNLETSVPSASAKRSRVNGVTKCASPTTVEPSKRTRQFHCTECQATMDSVTLLREHRATHLREYKCDMCYKKFNTLYEHDFHRIVCLAEKEACQEQKLVGEHGVDTVNDDKKSVVRSERSAAKSTISRRVTRAQSRVRTDVVEKPTVRRRLTVLTSVSQYVHEHSNSEDSDMDDEDDEVSVADSMDSRRRVYTGDWLDRRNDSEVYELPDIQIDSRKEYDLYLLERLKAQIKAQEFTCLADDCDFFTDTLLNLMLHDYVHHFKSSWFYCPKCGSVFTSKVFLDYHLDRQNGGRFICYKCNEQFMFQHQLDLHLIYHSKQLNHMCDKCKCEFLTEEKLFQHMKLEHSNETEKHVIRIQSKATFASTRPNNEIESLNGGQRKKYTVKILNMRLPYMPSKRPLELPGHKPYRRRIGVIEFENERNPNCCSCK